ncbi:hypothetical protein pdam_00023916 [Pocillopora damicornis]|uniref:Uncharacterized protein n=1 Tax=Pocillopora damicornis TaxID=46731 RepID=A0A3M6TZ75_POCDA|nr:hypothetical protein pdam_00023916 [Pocillopora damicornis]
MGTKDHLPELKAVT